MARTRKRGSGSKRGARVQPRIVSRPAVLPTTKDSATRTLINGIDNLADVMRRFSDGSSTWKIKKGEARSVWVAHIRQKGRWDWQALHDVFVKIEGMKSVYKDISDRRLSFARLHYRQYDEDGNEVNEGWYAPSPLTTWENLVIALQEESNVYDQTSRARKYENTGIDEITISFASRANV